MRLLWDTRCASMSAHLTLHNNWMSTWVWRCRFCNIHMYAYL